jgi:arylformamidase
VRIIDISLPIGEGMVVWPGDPPFAQAHRSSIAQGDMCNLTDVHMSVHAGTHVDAPRHFLDGGATIEQLDLAAFIGPCRVVAVDTPREIARADLDALDLGDVERLLIKTRNSPLLRRGEFVEDYVGISPEAARFLAGIDTLRLVGLDYHSIGPFAPEQTIAVHQAILGRGIVALEGIDLSEVEPGRYELVALPLRIQGSDGSPVRAVLIDPGG